MITTGPRVAIFLPTMGQGGGLDRAAARLAQALTERAFPTTVLFANADVPDLAPAPPGVEYVDLASRATRGAVRPLARYLRSTRPAAAIGFMSSANLVLVAAARLGGRPCRVILTEHNHLSTIMRWLPPPRRQVMTVLTRRLYPTADALVAVSRGVAADLEALAGLHPGQVVTIYNPVLPTTTVGRGSGAPPHPWFGPHDPPVVLAAGRLTPQKNYATLVRAFAIVRGHRPARLVILGEGGERQSLLDLAQQLGVAEDLSLPGFVADPTPYMGACGVFVLSSNFEGLGMVLVEAMAAGAPLVSTDCPSGPREILGDGRFGALVDVGDHRTMALAIEQALDHPAPEVPLSHLEQFTQGAVADAYAGLIKG